MEWSVELVTWTSITRALLGLIILTNLKCLPFAWHIRLFQILAYHLLWKRSTRPQHRDVHGFDLGRGLFQPVKTASRCALLECDINGHKSDSTYFADLDLSRIDLIAKLFKDAISPSFFADPAASQQCGSKRKSTKMRVLLGGASCVWKREILPFQRYEVVSRVLSWDDKWLYIASQFVRPGSRSTTGSSEKEKVVDELIYASCVARYVFKSGRITVAPSIALDMLGLLPGKAGSSLQDELKPSETACKGSPDQDRTRAWTWDDVERERLRGLKVASGLTALDALFMK